MLTGKEDRLEMIPRNARPNAGGADSMIFHDADMPSHGPV